MRAFASLVLLVFAPAAAFAQGAPHAAPQGPLSKVGKRLNDAGFFPILFAGEWFVSNPDFGVREGSHQLMTQVNAGFDFNYHSTSVHFIEGFVPWITHQTATDNYFTQAGDVINGSASGYVPRKFHLARFTLEQKLFDNKAFIEGGKGYVNDYVARPLCLNAFMCMSPIAITHKATGFNFPNYSNWFARAGYNLTPELKAQGIYYKYDNNASLTSGWERSRSSNYPATLIDLQYAAPRASYPAAAELAYYYNEIPQTDQLCGTCVRSTTHWQSGIFAGGMKTFWRPEVGAPKMLQAFVSLGTAFNEKQTTSPSVGGMDYAVDAGVTLRAPFKGRPFDSYALQVTAVRLTRDEQTYLDNQGYGAPGRTEYAIGGSAVFKVRDYVFLSPYAEYLLHANAAFASNPVTNPTHDSPSDGFGVGLTFTILLGPLSGLNTKPSGYDGHYP